LCSSKPPHAIPSPTALVALVVLGLLCTAAAFVLYAALIAEVGAGRAFVVTYLNALVALLIGVAALDERLGPGVALEIVLILAGAWLATGGRFPRRRPLTTIRYAPRASLKRLAHASADAPRSEPVRNAAPSRGVALRYDPPPSGGTALSASTACNS